MVVDLTKILEIIKDPDLKIKINELYGENIKLKEENFSLKRELEKAKDFTELKSKLIHKDNHYFIKENDKEDGPFCTKCFDADNKLIRLHQGNLIEGVQYFTCPNCKTQTSTGIHIPTSHLVQRNRNGWDY